MKKKIVFLIACASFLGALIGYFIGVQQALLDYSYIANMNRDMKNLETALVLFYEENGHYLPADPGLSVLYGKYLDGPVEDAWGNRYRYSLVGGSSKPFLWSEGDPKVEGLVYARFLDSVRFMERKD